MELKRQYLLKEKSRKGKKEGGRTEYSGSERREDGAMLPAGGRNESTPETITFPPKGHYFGLFCTRE